MALGNLGIVAGHAAPLQLLRHYVRHTVSCAWDDKIAALQVDAPERLPKKSPRLEVPY
jgi:hypothetical protein